MFLDRAADLVAVRRDRQFFRIVDLRDARRTRGARGGRRGYLLRQRRLGGRDVIAAHLRGAQAIALAPQAMLVAAQAGIDRRFGNGIRRIHGRGRGPGAASRGPQVYRDTVDRVTNGPYFLWHSMGGRKMPRAMTAYSIAAFHVITGVCVLAAVRHLSNGLWRPIDKANLLFGVMCCCCGRHGLDPGAALSSVVDRRTRGSAQVEHLLRVACFSRHAVVHIGGHRPAAPAVVDRIDGRYSSHCWRST